MGEQLNILDAIQAKEEGMKTAVDHADKVCEGWSERAFELLKHFLTYRTDPFMVEDVRYWAEQRMGLPDPPSKRAWGAIIIKAKTAGLVTGAGYGKTRNPKAHRTPAAMWISNRENLKAA